MNRWSSTDEFQSFIDEGGIVEADDAMSDEYRAEVFKFIELHANSELMGGLTERDWIPRAPGLRRKMGVLAKTQDEIGHAHLLYMVAADLGVKTRRQMLEDLFAGRSRFHNVFHYAAVTWGDQVRDRLPRRRGGADQPAGGLQELLVRAVPADPATHHRRGGLPHASRRGDVADDRRGNHDPARSVPGGARPVVAAGAAVVRAGLEARRRVDALPHQVRAQRGAARPLGAEVRPVAHRIRLHHPRPRTAPRPRDRTLGDRPDRLVASQGHARQRRTRLCPPHRQRGPSLVRHRVGARRARRGRGGGGG